MPTAV